MTDGTCSHTHVAGCSESDAGIDAGAGDGSIARDASVRADAGDASSRADGSMLDANVDAGPPIVTSGGCGCAVPQRRRHEGGAALVALVALGLAIRARRRR